MREVSSSHMSQMWWYPFNKIFDLVVKERKNIEHPFSSGSAPPFPSCQSLSPSKVFDRFIISCITKDKVLIPSFLLFWLFSQVKFKITHAINKGLIDPQFTEWYKNCPLSLKHFISIISKFSLFLFYLFIQWSLCRVKRQLLKHCSFCIWTKLPGYLSFSRKKYLSELSVWF